MNRLQEIIMVIGSLCILSLPFIALAGIWFSSLLAWKLGGTAICILVICMFISKILE